MFHAGDFCESSGCKGRFPKTGHLADAFTFSDAAIVEALGDTPTTLVPCRDIGTEAEDWDCALLVFSVMT